MTEQPPHFETLGEFLDACTGDDTATAVEATLQYVCARMKLWTDEAVQDGITVIPVLHQLSRTERAADELRHYLTLKWDARVDTHVVTKQGE
ncbi:hypothetical protein PV646_28595 [Streptomyces sp. ID05-26A]|nr:hypothetical protein [Streptomyces sp. ID05-26A]